MKIGQIAQRAGIQASAIRFYESVGVIPKTARLSGKRDYDESTVALLRMVKIAKQAGFTIAEIKTLFWGFSPNTPPSIRWRKLAEKKVLEVNVLIERASEMKTLLEKGLRCSCMKVEECEIVSGADSAKENQRYQPRLSME